MKIHTVGVMLSYENREA